MEVRQISGYHIFEKLGEGITGTVYKAWDNQQQRPAAVKILREKASAELMRGFLATTRALVHVDHPNLVHIYEVGQNGDEVYIVSELVEGTSLKDLFLQRRHDRFDFLNLALQMAGGLKRIHDMKLVHGNLKPSNIFVGDDGMVKLLDAGLSPFKNFQQNPEFVAPYEPYHYLSPEYILSQEITPKSDLFSLGVIVYQLASGSLPFTGKNEDALCDAILNYSPNFPDLRSVGVSGDRILLIEKLLAKEPENRMSSTAELIVTLEEMYSFDRAHDSLDSFLRPPHNPRTYLSIAVLVALLLIFWYVVTSFKH